MSEAAKAMLGIWLTVGGITGGAVVLWDATKQDRLTVARAVFRGVALLVAWPLLLVALAGYGAREELADVRRLPKATAKERDDAFTNSKAYGQAQTALKEQEELTLSDEEIDKFLPKELRRTEIKASAKK